MKYLVIAEKPSVSKSIAKVIGAYRQEDGYLEGGDCVVSWCLGHLAEYAAPEHYDERYENWRFEDLPILPAEWKLLVHSTKKPQFNVLRKPSPGYSRKANRSSWRPMQGARVSRFFGGYMPLPEANSPSSGCGSAAWKMLPFSRALKT